MAIKWRKVGRRLVRVAAGAVFVYLAVAVVLFVFQRRLIYPAYMRDAPAEGGSGVEGLQKIWRELPDGQGRVEAWLLPGEGASAERPGPLVVFTHGNAELIDDWPDRLATYRRWGFNVLLPEYRGYGRSGGEPTQAGITEDLVWFLDRVKARPEVDPDRLVFHGRSLGGGAACALAARVPPKALILQSTFARLADLSGRFLMPSFLVMDEWDNESVVAKLDCPVLIMHGVHDDLVPFPHSRRLVEAARKPTFVSQDCHHSDCPPDDEERWRIVRAFLDEAGVGPSAGPAERPAAPVKTGADRAAIEPEVWKGEAVTLEVEYIAYSSLDAAFATLPQGSVDAVILDYTRPQVQQVVVDVKATGPSGAPPVRRFMTTFFFSDGRAWTKTWEAAEGNLSGTYKALISSPQVVTKAQTRPANAPAGSWQLGR